MPEITTTTTETVETLGELLRHRRGARGLRDVAEAAGINHGALSQYERSKRHPNLATLGKLSRVLPLSDSDWVLIGSFARVLQETS